MELLRRALLIGCALPALWLFRLATLDPLISVIHVTPAASQGQALASASSQVSGRDWDLFLGDIDALELGLGKGNYWRTSEDLPDMGGLARWVFFKPSEMPGGALLQRLASDGGTSFVSISRRDGDLRYRVDQREWTRNEFRPGGGFTGKPAPPSALLYPFQYLAFACLFVGIVIFVLIPSPTKALGGVSAGEFALLAVAGLLFVGPLVATGGSVQALTRGLLITLPCWILAAVALHFFANPGVNAPHPLLLPAAGSPGASPEAMWDLPTFLRWGLVMLAVAVGPLVALVAVSLTFWNR
jgi:hypothetical protein